MIPRRAKNQLMRVVSRYPITFLRGPKGSGKTTLARSSLSYAYISLSDFHMRDQARSNPWNFLSQHYDPTGSLIIDDIHHLPQLLPYIRQIVERNPFPGSFILITSREISDKVLGSQSYSLPLLPLTISESNSSLENLVYQGCHPSIVARTENSFDYHGKFMETFIDRELPGQLKTFRREAFVDFVRLCSSKIGEMINFSSLGKEVGISHNTAKSWISLLKKNYVIFSLSPYPQGFGKRAVKTEKLYFWDTGLACWLLGIHSSEQLSVHQLWGKLFENLILVDLLKQDIHSDLEKKFYFWRDKLGQQVDCLIETDDHLVPIKIKACKKVSSDDFEELARWNQLAKRSAKQNLVIYGGDEDHVYEQGSVLSWRSIDQIESRFRK